MLELNAQPLLVVSYSYWKLLAFSVIFGVLGVFPLVRHVGDDLRLNAWLFNVWSTPIRLLLCGVAILMSALMLPVLLRAIVRAPALIVTQETVTVYALYKRVIPRLQIVPLPSKTWYGVLIFPLKGRRRGLELPISIYKNGNAVEAELRRLLS